MSFAERNGIEATKPLQINGIDESLRNRLMNIFDRYINKTYNGDEIARYVLDRLGYIFDYDIEDSYITINNHFMGISRKSKWYSPYDILEYAFAAHKRSCQGCDLECDNLCTTYIWLKDFPNSINLVLQQEKSGYRMVVGKFILLTNEQELASIEEASDSPFRPVNIHINKALTLFSSKEFPDYENSIKESISAVESICCIITNLSGKGATLGAAIKKLKDHGLEIHGAMENAFERLFGYTSDADGIRHGGIDFTDVPEEDAKFMLIACSAFVNYLIEKNRKYIDFPHDDENN